MTNKKGVIDFLKAAEKQAGKNLPPINFDKLETFECPQLIDGKPCNGKTFIQASQFKKLPGVHPASGGQDRIIPIKGGVCVKCWKGLWEAVEKEGG